MKRDNRSAASVLAAALWIGSSGLSLPVFALSTAKTHERAKMAVRAAPGRDFSVGMSAGTKWSPDREAGGFEPILDPQSIARLDLPVEVSAAGGGRFASYRSRQAMFPDLASDIRLLAGRSKGEESRALLIELENQTRGGA